MYVLYQSQTRLKVVKRSNGVERNEMYYLIFKQSSGEISVFTFSRNTPRLAIMRVLSSVATFATTREYPSQTFAFIHTESTMSRKECSTANNANILHITNKL